MNPTGSAAADAPPAPEVGARQRAARIAGGGLLLMAVLAIFANFVVVENLLVAGDGAATVENIVAEPMLFRWGIVAFVGVFLLDVLVAWALHVHFRHVNRDLSLLMAWSRLAYAAILGIALHHLLDVLRLVTGPAGAALDPPALHGRVIASLDAFDSTWQIGLTLFALHLLVLGALVLQARHVPSILGVLLLAAGAGYAVDGLAQILLPSYAEHEALFLVIVAVPGVIGELAFAAWLVLRGGRRATRRPGARDAEVRT